MDFQKTSRPLPSVLSGQFSFKWFPTEDLVNSLNVSNGFYLIVGDAENVINVISPVTC